MDPTAPLVHRLVARWAHQGTSPLAPPRVELLDRLEQDPTLRLPADLRAYFRITGGLPDLAWDEEAIAWWSADRIVPLATIDPGLEDAAGFFIDVDREVRQMPQDAAKVPAIGLRHGVIFLPPPGAST